LLRIRAQHLSATTPLRVTIDAPARLPLLPPAVESAALRILDEALTNVVRHAAADTCTVTVSLDDALRLEVRDDGRGYDGPRPGGVGVESMTARASALGGTCEVFGDENGTRVVVELPVAVRVPA
jgi:signal transduction histidine kinase